MHVKDYSCIFWYQAEEYVPLAWVAVLRLDRRIFNRVIFQFQTIIAIQVKYSWNMLVNILVNKLLRVFVGVVYFPFRLTNVLIHSWPMI